MNIVWITNVIFPAPSKALGLSPPVTGGWLYSMVEQVGLSPDIKLAVATIYQGKELKRFDINGLIYYLLPLSKDRRDYQKSLEPLWEEVRNEFRPDVVHIHGTEFSHGLACMRSCPRLKYIVSIQGLVGVISRYYYAGMSMWDIISNITFRDIVRCDTIFQSKKSCEKREVYEKEYISRAHMVSGRTSWDYAHVKYINPSVGYLDCNRTLRAGFYLANKWNINDKRNYTIFLSQAYYPLKGAHQVFKAISLLKNDYPEIRVRVAGHNIISNTTFSEKIRLSGYGNYLRKVIKKAGLQNNVQFLGALNEQQMIAEYQNAHIFICPSSIENSPNSLGEAQLLGTPAIAAYAGGIPDMIIHGETGLLYRFEEIEMLSENIRRVFTDDSLANHLSLNGISAAQHRHDCQINLDRILDIYHEIGIN